MAARVTQEVVEVLVTPDTRRARVTQLPVEALVVVTAPPTLPVRSQVVSA